MGILERLTKRFLRLNKKRTIVTIIGIIISGAMITAVTTLATSFQGFMINVQEGENGKWLAQFYDVNYSDVRFFENNNNFVGTCIISPYMMTKNIYSDENFMDIRAFDRTAFENMGIKFISGKLPTNSDEIAISKTFFDGKGNEPKVGDIITLDYGDIVENSGVEIKDSKIDNKDFIKAGNKSFKICGIIEKPRFESGEDYTSAVTLLDNNVSLEGKKVSIGIIDKNPSKIYDNTKSLADELGLFSNPENGEKIYKIQYNTNVLIYMGVNDNSGFSVTLIGVCAILIFVIGVGSVLVIYNAFAISVSERKREFGMLASIGATKKQIKHSVLYEGIILGIIGIPLGIISGIGGIWITLKIVNNLLQSIVNLKGLNWELKLIISWPAILIAVILIAITIYMSVIIPARRASKISPIDAIRQNDDIKVKYKKVKTPKFIRKLFGIEGDIALKNLKRSKKRYRTTVISLIISIILYITVSGFVQYMFTGFEGMYYTPEYDYVVQAGTSKNLNKCEEAINKVEKIQNLNECTIAKQLQAITNIPKDRMDKKVLDFMEKDINMKNYFNDFLSPGKYETRVNLITLNESEYQKYLKKIGVDKLQDNQIILINYVNAMAINQMEFEISNYKAGEKIKVQINEHYEDEREVPNIDYEIVKVTDKIPFGIDNTSMSLTAITTQKGLENMIKLFYKPYISNNAFLKVNKENRADVEGKLKELETTYSDIGLNVMNIQEIAQTNNNFKNIIQIFLYGFIILISAIGISNIFNTISTNVNLRRREFANLKSIGMTNKQFKKMLDLECIFYGTKALLYGIPLGVGICFLLNKAFTPTAQFIFRLPWISIGISIITVYTVVFATMMYSSKKVKKEIGV